MLLDGIDAPRTGQPIGNRGNPQSAPGPLTWIEGAGDWELSQRRGFDHPLLPPETARDPPDGEVSINAAMVLRDQFAKDSAACSPSSMG